MASYKNIVLADSPVMYLRLGEPSGTVALDSSSTGANDGTYVGSPTLGVTGALVEDPNLAVTLNGTSQYVTVADAAALDVGNNFTLEAWVKRSVTGAGNTDQIFRKGNNNFGVFFDSSDLLSVSKAGGAVLMTGGTITDTNWHHIVVTSRTPAGSFYRIYVDGVDVSNPVTTGTLSDTATDLYIGASDLLANFFHGSIDEVAIYNIAHQASTVAAHYAAGVIGRVPRKFDVLINGEGYLLANSELQRAKYGYSPTFVERQNVTGDYGDNQQAFWLTHTQRDWSAGEGQRYYRQSDDRPRKYWQGTSIDIRKQGEVTLRQSTVALTFPATPVAAARNAPYVASAANLYSVGNDATITSLGAHGLGASPSSLVYDGKNVFLTTVAAGTVGVRKWNGSAYSTFSASSADYLEFHNNTLYGLVQATGKLVKWSSTGTRSDVTPWKYGDGTAAVNPFPTASGAAPIRSFGGRLLVLAQHFLWSFDGASTSRIAEFPPNFTPHQIEVLFGTVFISGYYPRKGSGGNLEAKGAVYYLANGQIGLLWQADNYTTVTADAGVSTAPALVAYDGGIVFVDYERGQFMYYDGADGGVHSAGTCQTAHASTLAPAKSENGGFFVQCYVGASATTSATYYPGLRATAAFTSGTVTSSLIDFDSSLDKYFKAVKVDWTAATDGDGGSVDIAYALNDVAASFTTAKVGATNGSEYAIEQTARAISVKITLNKGTSTLGPKLKRVYVRGVPIENTFKRRSYLLDLSGVDGKTPLRLRDGSDHTKDGSDMGTDLNAAAVLTVPFPITDRFGTFAGVIEADGYQLVEIRPGEFEAQVTVREV